MKRRCWLWLVPVVVALGADQLGQWLLVEDGMLGDRRLAPFDPPLFVAAQHASVQRLEAFARGADAERSNVRLDAELGWAPVPGSHTRDFDYDEYGARVDGTPLRARKSPEVRRIVTIGCSFTHGDEVADGETWAARMEARRPDLEIANLGVGAYGIDQALLRWRRDGLALQPDEVWLTWVPDLSLRVTALYPPAYRHHDPVVASKPRFVLDESQADSWGLRLVPNPAPDGETLAALLFDQQAFVAAFGDDFWVGREPAAYAPRGSHWSHAFLTTRLLLTRSEGQSRDPAPWLVDPTSEPRRLIEGIVRLSAREAEAAGARFRLVVMLDYRDLGRAAAGARPWAGILDALAAAGIEILDTTALLLESGALHEESLWQAGGHYAPALHDALAASFVEAL